MSSFFFRPHDAFCRRSATGDGWDHPQYFDHNALYHVLQAIALILAMRQDTPSRRDVYKLGRFLKLKRKYRPTSVRLCELSTIAGLEQT
jgi:hypothetical protein